MFMGDVRDQSIGVYPKTTGGGGNSNVIRADHEKKSKQGKRNKVGVLTSTSVPGRVGDLQTAKEEGSC